jgi:hypothetical protein
MFVSYFEFKLALLIGYLFAIGIVVRTLCNVMANKPKSAMLGSLRWTVPLLALPTLLVVGVGIYDLLGHLQGDGTYLYQKRNFFGVLKVSEYNDSERNPPDHYYLLKHGNITHGLQFADARRRLPTTYYGTISGVGRTLGFYRRQADEIGGMRVGAVGLGTGTVAAYLDEGDFIQFYEINPEVVEISATGKWFTFLSECDGKVDVKLGDARLSMEREPQSQRFHVLILDAFSGDAIPTHLLTEEAFRIYLRHLATPENGKVHGAIAVHISNRYLNLEPVVRGLAERFKLRQVQIDNEDGPSKVYRSDWIILTYNDKLADELKQSLPEDGQAADAKDKLPKAILWTDNFNNVYDVLR